ncbi:class I SAM-dependent methyltransferase [Pelomonas sp. SE-A7]|uniref:class I SAM-dependent methyltransferase n=1 Tax=Pelomonas sp. SE-A7 TaxID=3054953 RepID=UPI00259C85A3|nr:class I SAM-dependent methyltransferase [Pelomonas sp. SE-A7]MDM4764516.1 class I SAM-dependent methyltransferase [Pelomonas sp. SE-A7]
MSSTLIWPLAALASWAACWFLYFVLQPLAGPFIALAAASGLGLLLAWPHARRWRRLIIAAGFPLSLLAAAGQGALPAWAWLLPLGLLLLAYPQGSWRDAPLFPTPVGALEELPAVVPLQPDERVLDAGCGLGAGLIELHRVYPEARLDGIEWSRLLALLVRLRCHWAEVRQGDMWAADWSVYRVVYLFQRPESMERAWTKAATELKPGAWLVSLDFEVAGRRPHRSLELLDGRRLWVYRIG